jgi:hypothetical protein
VRTEAEDGISANLGESETLEIRQQYMTRQGEVAGKWTL